MARTGRSPYEGARVEELEEPLLPRWFVLLALAALPTAIAVGIAAFVVFGPERVPVEARRPPPAAGSSLSTDVGQLNVGDLPPAPIEAGCPLVTGVQAAGTAGDRARIQTALNALCDITVPGEAGEGIGRLGAAGGVVRFAQFERTGVDSALDTATDPPTILVNARFAREGTEPRWIAPLVVHDAVLTGRTPGTVEAELAARQAEATVCDRLFTETDPSRACRDAAELLALPDPAAALAEAGFDAG